MYGRQRRCDGRTAVKGNLCELSLKISPLHFTFKSDLIVHEKRKILSLFIHLLVILNLYAVICSPQTTKREFLEIFLVQKGTKTVVHMNRAIYSKSSEAT